MKNNNVIARTQFLEANNIDSVEYILRRKEEILKNYPHATFNVMDYAKKCFERDKKVFDSVFQGNKLYSRVVIEGGSVFEEFRVVKRFVKNNRFFVEVFSAWLNKTIEADIAALLTKEEITGE